MSPLRMISKLISEQSPKVNDWFEEQWQGLTPRPYFSCDIRHANYKMGIIDTNLFPGGFNNLCNSFTHATAEAFRQYFGMFYPHVRTIGLLCENHTRNKFYLLNVLKIQNLLIEAGFECLVTMPLDHYPSEQIPIVLSENETLTIYKPNIASGNLILNSIQTDIVLSNNDFSAGIPKPFDGLSNRIIPAPELGWHKRRKSNHFKLLAQVIQDFAKAFDIDSWLITPISTIVQASETDLSELASAADDVIQIIQKKYDEYGISEPPYVYIKNDAGTYGLGMVNVSSGEELLNLNRKKRSKLFSAKSGTQTEQFLIQEGIPTTDTYSNFPIEPVMYGVGKTAVGGFFRIHEGKNAYESLNAPGMLFSCLCLHKLDEPHESDFINCKTKSDLVQGSFLLSRFAALAAAKE